MFGLSQWERGLRKLKKHPQYTEGTIINKYHGPTPELLDGFIESKIITRIDIEYTTESGITKQILCGGKKAEKLCNYDIGDKLPIAYAEYKGVVYSRVRFEQLSDHLADGI